MLDLKVYKNDSTLNITIRDGLYLAQIETSRIDTEIAQGALASMGYTSNKSNWYFFNRLVVPPKLQGRGYAKAMLHRLSHEIKIGKINVLLQAAAYGTLQQDDLEKLYLKHGFRRVNQCVFVQEYDNEST